MAKAEIYYFSLTDEMTREDKLAWFKNTKFQDIPLDRITPDKKHNWINLTDNDFDELLPLIDKEVKAGKSEKAIFKLFSLGVKTDRDEWMYGLTIEDVSRKVDYFINAYMNKVNKKKKKFLEIKWDSELLQHSIRGIQKTFYQDSIIPSPNRPYSKKYLYYDLHLNKRLHKTREIKRNEVTQNILIAVTCHTQIPFVVQGLDSIPSMDVGGRPTQNLPLYRYNPEGDREDNITDWGLQQIQTHYNDPTITKPDIFHYTYAILHHPAYRQKYEINLKRDFPRLPLYENFHQWKTWGEQLMDWHIHYETIPPHGLQRHDIDHGKKHKPAYKAKLKADKTNGQIILDTETTLTGIPAIAWDYKLGNRSAIEWVLDQHKEKTPKDPTIRELFNTYRFLDYKDHVIDLLDRVCTVSLRTMELITQMPDTAQHQPKPR
jgi:predicted helicase